MFPRLKPLLLFMAASQKRKMFSKIKAALQLHYAGLDEGVNAGIPAYEEALKKNNITYEQYMYEGVNHAFHNDTATARYNEAAAKLAWQRTLDFFANTLNKVCCLNLVSRHSLIGGLKDYYTILELPLRHRR